MQAVVAHTPAYINKSELTACIFIFPHEGTIAAIITSINYLVRLFYSNYSNNIQLY